MALGSFRINCFLQKLQFGLVVFSIRHSERMLCILLSSQQYFKNRYFFAFSFLVSCFQFVLVLGQGRNRGNQDYQQSEICEDSKWLTRDFKLAAEWLRCLSRISDDVESGLQQIPDRRGVLEIVSSETCSCEILCCNYLWCKFVQWFVLLSFMSFMRVYIHTHGAGSSHSYTSVTELFKMICLYSVSCILRIITRQGVVKIKIESSQTIARLLDQILDYMNTQHIDFGNKGYIQFRVRL